MANYFLSYILSSSRVIYSHAYPQIQIVFDLYLENSIKYHAQEKRTSGIGGNLHCVLNDLEIPKEIVGNKLNLVELYSKLFLSYAGTHLHENQHLYLGGGLGEKAHVVVHSAPNSSS